MQARESRLVRDMGAGAADSGGGAGGAVWQNLVGAKPYLCPSIWRILLAG